MLHTIERVMWLHPVESSLVLGTTYSKLKKTDRFNLSSIMMVGSFIHDVFGPNMEGNISRP